MRFTHAELLSFQGALVDDLIGENVRMLFVGINPGLWTAAVNAHFARAGNRFWPALHAAGITPYRVDASKGMSDEDRDMVVSHGIAISNIVPMATARADELDAAQLNSPGSAQGSSDTWADGLSTGLCSIEGGRRVAGRDSCGQTAMGSTKPQWTQRSRHGQLARLRLWRRMGEYRLVDAVQFNVQRRTWIVKCFSRKTSRSV